MWEARCTRVRVGLLGRLCVRFTEDPIIVVKDCPMVDGSALQQSDPVIATGWNDV